MKHLSTRSRVFVWGLGRVKEPIIQWETNEFSFVEFNLPESAFDRASSVSSLARSSSTLSWLRQKTLDFSFFRFLFCFLHFILFRARKKNSPVGLFLSSLGCVCVCVFFSFSFRTIYRAATKGSRLFSRLVEGGWSLCSTIRKSPSTPPPPSRPFASSILPRYSFLFGTNLSLWRRWNLSLPIMSFDFDRELLFLID